MQRQVVLPWLEEAFNTRAHNRQQSSVLSADCKFHVRSHPSISDKSVTKATRKRLKEDGHKPTCCRMLSCWRRSSFFSSFIRFLTCLRLCTSMLMTCGNLLSQLITHGLEVFTGSLTGICSGASGKVLPVKILYIARWFCTSNAILQRMYRCCLIQMQIACCLMWKSLWRCCKLQMVSQQGEDMHPMSTAGRQPLAIQASLQQLCRNSI